MAEEAVWAGSGWYGLEVAVEAAQGSIDSLAWWRRKAGGGQQQLWWTQPVG